MLIVISLHMWGGLLAALTCWQHHTLAIRKATGRSSHPLPHYCHAALAFRHRQATFFSMLSDVSIAATVCSSPARILRDIHCALHTSARVPLQSCITSPPSAAASDGADRTALALLSHRSATDESVCIQFTSRIQAQCHQLPPLVMSKCACSPWYCCGMPRHCPRCHTRAPAHSSILQYLT
jgi:hypothetical protein